MTDIMDNPFDPFADAVEATLQGFRTEIAGLRGELSTALTEVRSLKAELETRSVPVQPTIDVEAIATRAASLIPAPKDGRDGKDGEPGKDGTPGKDGIDGKDGTPGLNGERGADGVNGRDGIATREELDTLIEQRVEARFADVQVRSFADIYRGTYDPANTYTRGLTTTWDGSLWLSERDTNRQPGTTDSGWKLITKRGRDGRDKR